MEHRVPIWPTPRSKDLAAHSASQQTTSNNTQRIHPNSNYRISFQQLHKYNTSRHKINRRLLPINSHKTTQPKNTYYRKPPATATFQQPHHTCSAPLIQHQQNHTDHPTTTAQRITSQSFGLVQQPNVPNNNTTQQSQQSLGQQTPNTGNPQQQQLLNNPTTHVQPHSFNTSRTMQTTQ